LSAHLVAQPQTLSSNQAMADAMKGAAKVRMGSLCYPSISVHKTRIGFLFLLSSDFFQAMKKMNGSLNLPALQKIMMEFEKQSDMMDLKEEMMEDTMDDVLGEEVCDFISLFSD
jgi:hypothetical protein